MKTLIFMAIFFSGSLIFSMNSTENRQALVELYDFDSSGEEIVGIDASLNMIYQEGQLGSRTSQRAYSAFMDIADRKFPILTRPIMAKLAQYSLAYRKPQTSDFVVDECKVSLWNKYRSKRNNDG